MTREFANQFVVSYTVGTMQLVRRYLLLLLFAVHWDSLRLLRYSCLGECAAWLPTSPGGDDLGFGGQMSRVEGRLNLEFTNALMNDEWIRAFSIRNRSSCRFSCFDSSLVLSLNY